MFAEEIGTNADVRGFEVKVVIDFRFTQVSFENNCFFVCEGESHSEVGSDKAFSFAANSRAEDNCRSFDFLWESIV